MSHDLTEFIIDVQTRRQLHDARREFADFMEWVCENYHFNPDTGGEYENAWWRDSCEICGRPRPSSTASSSGKA